MAKQKNIPQEINSLYDVINEIIEQARNKVYRTANFTMVQAYWNIGKAIVEEEQKGKKRAEYGKEIIKKLAQKLSKKHGKSFSERNLWYMKQFYQKWTNLNALRSELSWTHYRLLLKVENDQRIKEIEMKPNSRPRKRFNFETPLEVMDNLLFNQEVAFCT